MIQRNLLSLFAFLPFVSATVSDCGSQWSLRAFSADPPGVVGAGQNVTIAFTFQVPFIVDPHTAVAQTFDDGAVTIQGALPGLGDVAITDSLCKYLTCPLTAGIYNWSWTSRFPEEVLGRVETRIRIHHLLAPRDQSWVCVRWDAYATSVTSNSTNPLLEWLFS